VFARTALIAVALATFLGPTQFAAARLAIGVDFKPASGAVPGHGEVSRSVSHTDQTWVCRGPVDLDSVSVTMTSAITSRRGADAIHLEPGCTGRIGQLQVLTAAGDAVKVAEGVHDLAIDGGSILCTAKLPTMHQDGIQVMGGERITLRGLSINCGRPGESLINSNLFINQGGRSANPPTDVVCVDCFLGGAAAHTASIQNSVRSGVVSSTLCTAKYPKLTLTVGPLAVDPVDSDNVLGTC
jgi:hypothetical protein